MRTIPTPEEVLEIGRRYSMEIIVTALPPQEILAHFTPAERVAGLSFKERLAGLSVEQIEDYLKRIEQSLNGNGRELFGPRGLRKTEALLATGKGDQTLQELLSHLKPEEVLSHYKPQERLAGLSASEIRAYLKQLESEQAANGS